MKKFLLFGAVAAAGALTFPAAAHAVPGGEQPGFVALSEIGRDGKVVSVPAHAGETVAVTAGVAFNNNISPRGAVVRIRTLNDVTLPKTFTNCLYVTDADAQVAWCKFEETIQMGTAFEMAGFKVTVAATAAGELDDIGFEWFGGNHDEANGGLAALAEAEEGSKPRRGDQR
ncbi:MAG: hypothetical protein ABW046_00785, partial [Actinoplanes sp.]